MKAKNIKKIDIDEKNLLYIFLREIAYQTALANERTAKFEETLDSIEKVKTGLSSAEDFLTSTQQPKSDHQWNQETLNNTSSDVLQKLANAAIQTIRERGEMFYLLALNSTFVGNWEEFPTGNLETVRHTISEELARRGISYFHLEKMDMEILESFQRGIHAELAKRRGSEVTEEAKHANEVVAEDGAKKLEHQVVEIVDGVPKLIEPYEDQPKNETPIAGIPEVDAAVRYIAEQSSEPEPEPEPDDDKVDANKSENWAFCTRVAGHDGPCNGYPRVRPNGLHCYEANPVKLPETDADCIFRLKKRPTRLHISQLRKALDERFPNNTIAFVYDSQTQKLKAHPGSCNPDEVETFFKECLLIPSGTVVSINRPEPLKQFAPDVPSVPEVGPPQLNLEGLHTRLSQYYPGYGSVVWYAIPQRLEVLLAKDFRPENRERIMRMIREHQPYGQIKLVL